MANNEHDAENTAIATRSFLWLSDLHYDPLFGKPGAYDRGKSVSCASFHEDATHYACDASGSLVRSAVTNGARRLASSEYAVRRAPFALVSGDFSRHGTDKMARPKDDLKRLLTDAADVLVEALGEGAVVPSVGNNDFTPDYYLETSVADHNPALDLLADALSRLLNSEEEERDFRRGGYLARDVDDGLTVLSLNTVIYSVYHEPKDHTDDDPLGQFAWMTRQFEEAHRRNRKVWLVGHVPPTLGSYERAALWQERFRRRFDEVVRREGADVVSARLFGHQHSDEFRVDDRARERDGGDDVTPLPPMLCTSSVTSVFSNNPSFRIVTYDASETGDRGILDHDVYYYDDDGSADETALADDLNVKGSSSWSKLYSFREAYDVPDMSAKSLEELVDRVETKARANAEAFALGTTTTKDGEGDTKDSVDERQSTFLPNPVLDTLLRYHYQVGKEGSDAVVDCDLYCQFGWVCLLRSGSANAYKSCAKRFTSEYSLRGRASQTVQWEWLSFAILVLACAEVYRRRWRRRHEYAVAKGLASDLDLVGPTTSREHQYDYEDDDDDDRGYLTEEERREMERLDAVTGRRTMTIAVPPIS